MVVLGLVGLDSEDLGMDLEWDPDRGSVEVLDLDRGPGLDLDRDLVVVRGLVPDSAEVLDLDRDTTEEALAEDMVLALREPDTDLDLSLEGLVDLGLAQFPLDIQPPEDQ